MNNYDDPQFEQLYNSISLNFKNILCYKTRKRYSLIHLVPESLSKYLNLCITLTSHFLPNKFPREFSYFWYLQMHKIFICKVNFLINIILTIYLPEKKDFLFFHFLKRLSDRPKSNIPNTNREWNSFYFAYACIWIFVRNGNSIQVRSDNYRDN